MNALAELFDKAQLLPPVEREQLAIMLLDSLPGENDVPVLLDRDYEAEIERRLEAIRSGSAKGHDLAFVMESLRATLEQPRTR